MEESKSDSTAAKLSASAESAKASPSKANDAECLDSTANVTESKATDSVSHDGVSSFQRHSTKENPKQSPNTTSSANVYSSHTKTSKAGKPKNKMIKPAANQSHHQTSPATSHSFNPSMKKNSNISSPNTATPKMHPQSNNYAFRHGPYGQSGYSGMDSYHDGHSAPNAAHNLNPPPTSGHNGSGGRGAAKSSTSPMRSNQTHQFSPHLELHPLQSTWCLWILADRQSTDVMWKDKMKEAHEFSTVETFWSMYFNIHPPSALGMGDYYLFREGIAPDWNDKVFHNGGGRFVIQVQSKGRLLDDMWLMVMLLMIGERYDNSDNSTSVCGAVVSCRAKMTKIALWVAAADPHKIFELGSKFFAMKGKESVAHLPEGKHDLKQEFESFAKGTAIDSLLNQPLGDKLTISWADLQKNYSALTSQ